MQVPLHTGVEEHARASRSPPSEGDVRAQLERILDCPEFPTAGQGHAFLRYVVEEALSGRGDRIKAYSIAIEVFNRDERFTQDDPVVRIEAGRLRRALERYYLISGQNDPVRIDIPKGRYVPSFEWAEPPPAPVAPDPEPAPQPSISDLLRHWITPSFVTALLLAVSAGLIAFGLLGRPPSASSRAGTALAPDEPTLVIAPFANLGEGLEAKLYTTGLTEELLTALPRFKELKVYGRETSESLSPEVDPSLVRGQLGAHYLLAGGVRASGDRVRVTARLLDTATGAIVWSETYDNDLRSRGLFEIQSDVANKVATAVAQPYGIISQLDSANPPPDDLGAYACTLHFYAYRTDLSAEQHAVVRDCLESAVARYPTYATAWAMLSITYLDEDRFKYNERSGSPAPLERALKAARRSVELDPSNTRALQALMTVLFFNRQLTESLRIGEQALATNPNDTELMGEYGTRLALSGQWQRGAALLKQALSSNPGAGGYYHGSLALAAYMLHDDDTAFAEIKQTDLQKFPLFHLIAAVIYAERGLASDATREGAAFVEMRPGFLPNLRAELDSRNIRPEDQARMIAGVRKAGLALPADLEARNSLPNTLSDLQPR